VSEKWIVGEPGGPAGPFWSVVTSSGRAVALQVITKKDAELIAFVGNAINGYFENIRQVSEQLRSICERDFADMSHLPIKSGSFDYVTRSVFEAIEKVGKK